jgi:hypothetical protein
MVVLTNALKLRLLVPMGCTYKKVSRLIRDMLIGYIGEGVNKNRQESFII